jgi:hypothetical protein
MIWNKGKQEHWKEVPPPDGWDPKWPAIFVVAHKAVWGDDGAGNLDFAMETHLHGLCNGPEIARFLKHKTNAERPTLWALVPVGHLDYSQLEGSAAYCLPLPKAILPAGE